MNKLFLSTALASAFGVLTGCAVTPGDPGEETTDESTPSEQAAPEKTGSASEAVAAPAEQVCCSNIGDWGSVIYYQSWGGYGWITGSTFYHQGTSCPGTDGACQRVNPSQ